MLSQSLVTWKVTHVAVTAERVIGQKREWLEHQAGVVLPKGKPLIQTVRFLFFKFPVLPGLFVLQT